MASATKGEDDFDTGPCARRRSGTVTLEALGLRGLDRRRVFSENDADAATSPALRRRLEAEGVFKMTKVPTSPLACRSCSRRLNVANGDNVDGGLCKACRERADREMVSRAGMADQSEAGKTGGVALSALEKSMIARVYGFMPTSQLLKMLNDRRTAEAGKAAVLLTMDAIHQEIAKVSAPQLTGEMDYPSLRKLLGQAAKDGTLAMVTEQLINDFAVIFSLTAKQVMNLKEVLISSEVE